MTISFQPRALAKAARSDFSPRATPDAYVVAPRPEQDMVVPMEGVVADMVLATPGQVVDVVG